MATDNSDVITTDAMPADPVWPRSAVVVGGGSWGQVLLRELIRMGTGLSEIHLVSAGLSSGARRIGDDLAPYLRAEASPHITLWPTAEDFLKEAQADVALVANRPAEHFKTAMKLLASGMHTMVEKPVSLNHEELDTLVTEARDRSLVAAAGLEFLAAPFVAEFRHLITSAGPDSPSQAVFTWHDTQHDQRRGAPRRFDPTVNVVADLYPHILSLLAGIFGPATVRLGEVLVEDGGWSARLSLVYGSLPVSVSLSRLGSTPVRQVRLIPADGSPAAVLDFTRTPAVAYRDGGPPSALATAPTPVERALRDFLTACLSPGTRSAITLTESADLHHAVIDAHAAVGEEQRRMLGRALTGGDGVDAHAVHRALAEHLGQGLMAAGLADPADERSLRRWTDAAFVVMRRLAADAFTGQRELMTETGLPTAETAALNRLLRGSALVQRVVVEDGVASKYWQNTVLPLRRSGALEAVAQRRYAYPFRVGLYPGLSCMFACTFCGRNREAAYRRDDAAVGHGVFSSMLATAPTDDPHRFYISGGLEPLTNPLLGELVTAGAERGFQLALYTNGYLLTQRTLDRQPGLWDLATVRVSLYGPDESAMRAVTGRAHAFDKVVGNVAGFLRLRNARQSPIRVGFNYVVLPGQAARVLDVIELIGSINRAAGGRGIDFLTLREDYSVPGGGFSEAERNQLYEILAEVEDRTVAETEGLVVDYGYALDGIRRGLPSPPLVHVDDSQVRSTGYPQISVVVDPLGDVYLYREAGFLRRKGADRYIVGRVSEQATFEDIVRGFVDLGRSCPVQPGDTRFFDAFDHAVTLAVRQTEGDAAAGLPMSFSPVDEWWNQRVLAHPTLPSNHGAR